MGLLSFFKRDKAAPAAKRVSDSADAVQQLRLRARHRLIGAAVLVGVGVIGFPLVFETQPRPIPVDLPIQIPSKDGAAPLAIPQPRPAQAQPQQQSLPPLAAADHPGLNVAPASASEGKVAPAAIPTPAPVPAAAKAAERGAEQPSVKPTERLIDKPTEKVADKHVDKTSTKPLLDKPADKAAEKRSAAASDNSKHSPEAARVQALLEGRSGSSKPADAAASTRHILQIGAYADSKSAQEVRMKVERLGLKTYTQAVDTAAGKRIRVRLGPYASREEADKAAAKLKSAGLSAAVLTL
ncbi:SPOR domain-containing protein [Paucibacter sp. DJ2R-2]|uniref:SPOR domain-containing protein n=1 Tax=Paucibacter sp. DJ2R-2 TaxID=2893558 RepID=UPI0021E42D93|nr:SPOR domain-containing protein [Paucibacter sp. DJ2R-2]MCV2422912.1 SPOR domain-containing protein [Paucibacter sp. DJ4R-1]MCV2440808.1 SPOR domain-containing protein [Paucibacter sp. DJ2R-2]